MTSDNVTKPDSPDQAALETPDNASEPKRVPSRSGSVSGPGAATDQAGAARVAGKSVGRKVDRRLLQGDARYLPDILIAGGSDHLGQHQDRFTDPARVIFVRSPMAHARITEIGVEDARRMPGVLSVVTAADLDLEPWVRALGPTVPAFPQPVLASEVVRYVGEPVACVVAETLTQAVDAAEYVDVAYEPLEPVLDLETALDADPIFGMASNLATDTGWLGTEHVELDAIVEAAEAYTELTYLNPRQSPAPIEPRATAATWNDDGSLVVLSSTQVPHSFAKELASHYNLQPSQVTVINPPDVGGGFGGKGGRTIEERILPFLASVTDRSVAWLDTASEQLSSGNHGRGELFRFTLAGDRSGRITALKVDMIKDAGAYPGTGATIAARYTAPMTSGPYQIPHVSFRSRAVVTNKMTTAAFRGAGRAGLIGGLERAIDLHATRAGLDPAVVRQINLVPPSAMPYRTPTGGLYDEADYPADLRQALDTAEYHRLRAKQAERRSTDSPNQIGIGISCYNLTTTGAGGERAIVSIAPTGGARIITGTSDQGHGHRTTWAQLASETLGIDINDIEVIEGQTDQIATGVGAIGSRSAQTAGIAIHRASTTIVDRARSTAAVLLEAAKADIILDTTNGRFHVVGSPAQALSVGWAEVAASAHRDLACDVFVDAKGKGAYSSGTHIAVVTVDTETGQVTLNDFFAVDDTGFRINPMIVEGQLHGGIAAGISQALGETIIYDHDGNLTTANLMDYGLVSANQLPSLTLVPAQVATSFNELGIKGVGESGTVGATAAVHNAVVDAISHLGVSHMELPCTPERVWTAIQPGK